MSTHPTTHLPTHPPSLPNTYACVCIQVYTYIQSFYMPFWRSCISFGYCLFLAITILESTFL